MLAVDAYFLEFSGNSACGWVVDDAFSWNSAIAEGLKKCSMWHGGGPFPGIV